MTDTCRWHSAHLHARVRQRWITGSGAVPRPAASATNAPVIRSSSVHVPSGQQRSPRTR